MKWMWLVLPISVSACSKESVPATHGSAGSAMVVAVAPAPPPAPPVDAAVVKPEALTPDEIEHEQALQMADLLTTEDPSGGEGDMHSRKHPGADLAQQIRDVQVASSKGRVTLKTQKALEPTSLTADVVEAKLVTAYMAGIKRCYRQTLAADPKAHGDVKLSLAISPTGRTEPKVSSFSDTLDDCIAKQASNWRFPAPKDGEAEPTTAHFELVLLFVPD